MWSWKLNFPGARKGKAVKINENVKKYFAKMGTSQLSEKQYIILLNGFILTTYTIRTKEWHFCDSGVVKF